jgi:hypothetical protein
MALDNVCKSLNILDSPAREVIAERIIALSMRGERSSCARQGAPESGPSRPKRATDKNRNGKSASLVRPVTAERDSRVLILEGGNAAN